MESPSLTTQDQCLLGVGNVGKEYLRQVVCDGDMDGHDHPTRIVALQGHRDAIIVNKQGFSKKFLLAIAEQRIKVEGITEGQVIRHGGDQKRLQQVLIDLSQGREDFVVIDATAGKEDMLELAIGLVQKNVKLVLANKNPLTMGTTEQFRMITEKEHLVRYSTTIMAGNGAVPLLGEISDMNEPVTKIVASLSGTLGFITDKLSQGVELSKAIEEAKALGLTEPHFRDDLRGFDVARKLLILARECGWDVNLSDITVEPFVPLHCLESDHEQTCLRQIEAEQNGSVRQRYQEAGQQTPPKTWKYLATLEIKDGKPVLNVGLTLIHENSAFGRISGTENRIEAYTKNRFADVPLQRQGQGAGPGITAFNLRLDARRLQPQITRTRRK